ncbi:tRNA dimethylallyltransferase NDAI_0E00900 [Naumovozyma dairenensis CBS 421]|uniref:tRNA dimethylallyltransferase n=1 Tax=Naumovozyma dairenensis (strain ATCC 10597 / BCRC 20456 / CBS 421 / NBRC 0211 / NRRL Y-12639) TaxID=1071378 RepID=G0WAY6_NAUDC|nr:hypothetical protein NDAI_0E00900 [Naumovozyma dairenensis CBS 421]CCD24906.1 hypothetical protein NDAI_0E00900 [Naumovozyma dairenensis CBS 421]
MIRKTIQRIMPTAKKVIVIAGTTGVGKSQLSIQLATKFNGEIINSDSMQVYKDIPIISNKHPIGEREGIPHHVINHIDWTDEYYLHKFEEECLQTIEEIHSRGKIPIIVGGTHYYLQALFNKKVETGSRELAKKESEILNSNDPNLIYQTLMVVDPDIAKKYHPHDTRRVQRMLEIYYTTGKKPSEMYNDQQLTLRYNTLFLWLYSDPIPLDKRLDDRVDAMLESGGMDEINQLYSYYKENNFKPEQCENGVWQVIGFKEFLPWLEKSSGVTLEECVDKMKIRTRQYAKKQVKWIRKMLIPDINGDIYILNASDLDKWQNIVSKRANSIAEEFVNDTTIIEERAPVELSHLLDGIEMSTKVKQNKTEACEQFICEICCDQQGEKLRAIGTKNWEIHLKSRRHKRNLTRGVKKAQYEKWKAQNKSSTRV